MFDGIMMIRPLKADDVMSLECLAIESREEGFRFLERLLVDLRAGVISFDTPRHFFLGVFEHDEMVAVGGVTPDPYASRPDTGRIRHVFVTRAARRRGVGRALLNALETRACSQFLILRLRTDTATAAHFYERIGFERTSQPHATHLRMCAAGRAIRQPDAR